MCSWFQESHYPPISNFQSNPATSLSSPFSDKPSRQELAKSVMLKKILSGPRSEMLPYVKSDTTHKYEKLANPTM